MDNRVLIEKTCSRCDRFSWDSESGTYREVCPVDNRLCDASGAVYHDGVRQ